jgi:lactate dehydrogenase-like 2-hydroxyacid dehydrogenase
MKHKVLQYGKLMPSLEKQLAETFDWHRLVDEADPKAFVAARGREFVGLATAGFADAALIDALPSLKVISSFGVGVDKIDLAAAAKRGIPVGNTPDVLNDCVADLAIGLLLAASRGIAYGDRYVRTGKWLAGAMPLTTKVSGKRLGIVGMGRIGRAIAKRLSGFDMEIGYHTRRKQPDLPLAYYERLIDLAKDSDFLVLIVPGGKETFHMVNEEVLRALGAKGILINVARGSVVDETALVKCLQEGTLGGAGLDVFEDEPRMPEALWKMDNVVLTPHIASGTHETRAAMGKLCIDNLVEHFAGRPVLTPVP